MFYLLKYVHVLGATVLLGTGAGIAFFMLMAHRTGDVATIAGVARIVVILLKNSASALSPPICRDQATRSAARCGARHAFGGAFQQYPVIADVLFTATAALVQPMTGIALAWLSGHELTEGWIVLSVALYLLIGAFWLPVVWMQMKMRDLALAALAEHRPLPERYHKLFRIWFACGFPAFAAMLCIFWLMITRPVIAN